MISKKFGLIAILCLSVLACSESTDPNKMTVSGTVKGLRKGTLFLQKMIDTTLTTVDSLVISGDPNFKFSTDIESPEIFYLYLDKADHNDDNDRIMFFGEAGQISINTSWNFFEAEATIEGSKSHEKLKEYRKMVSRFTGKSLDLIKANFDYRKANDSVGADSIQKLIDKNKLRQYLFSLNYALNNKDSHISPFIALSEVFDANIKYLDTINNSLTEEVANSKYGKKLNKYIADIKAKENK